MIRRIILTNCFILYNIVAAFKFVSGALWESPLVACYHFVCNPLYYFSTRTFRRLDHILGDYCFRKSTLIYENILKYTYLLYRRPFVAQQSHKIAPNPTKIYHPPRYLVTLPGFKHIAKFPAKVIHSCFAGACNQCCHMSILKIGRLQDQNLIVISSENFFSAFQTVLFSVCLYRI